jgi:hypothetical protein
MLNVELEEEEKMHIAIFKKEIKRERCRQGWHGHLVRERNKDILIVDTLARAFYHSKKM